MIYNHPEKLPAAAEFICEASLGTFVEKGKPKKATNDVRIDFHSIMTLPINDLNKDTQLILRFSTV